MAQYMFQNWLLDGTNIGASNPIQLIMNTDHQLVAAYVQVAVKRILTVNSTPISVTLTIDGTPVPAGTNIELNDGQTVSVEAPATAET